MGALVAPMCILACFISVWCYKVEPLSGRLITILLRRENPVATEKKKGAGRAWLSGILIVVAFLFTPTAIAAHWATSQVTNTENFVSTLGPLASDPAVQQVIINEVTTLIDEQVDVQGLTESLFEGLGNALNLPPAAQDALNLVADPIAGGIKGMVKNLVTDAVTSEAFQQAWTKTLTLTQEQTIALLSGDPNSVVKLSNDGTLTLPLKPIIVDIKKALIEQGVTFAQAIPEVDRDITLGKIPELALARLVYQVGVGVGTWLPWIVAGLFIVGVALARNRPKAMLSTGVVFTVLMAGLWFIFTSGRVLAVTLIESTYSAAVGVIYDALVGYMIQVVTGLAAVGIVAAIVGWAFGASESAGKLRGFANKQMDALRKAIDPQNKGLAKVSPVLHQYRIVVRVIVVLLVASVLVWVDPITASAVLWATFLGLLVLFVYEVLQRQQGAAVAAKVATPASSAAPAPKAAAKPAAKKSSASASTAKKTTVAKPTATKTAAKKPATKKPGASSTATKKPVAKKPPTKKS